MLLSRRRFLAQSSLLTAASTLLPRTLRAQTGAPAGAPDAYAKPKPDITAPTPPDYPEGSGISGPGRPYDPAAPLEFHRGATGSAVKEGLLPPITPIWELHLRDTVICLGGDGNYYMTGSSGADIWDHNDGVELWRSTDLRKWDYLGLVWDTHKDGTWEKKPQDLHGKPVVTIWAPEIHYVKKNYFIVLSMAPGGISMLKSTTGKPQGPYTHAFSPDAPIVNAIDPTLFEDDDGKVYFTCSSATRIWLMKDDMSGFDGPPHPVTLSDPDHTPSHQRQGVQVAGPMILAPKGPPSAKRMADTIWALPILMKAATPLARESPTPSSAPTIHVTKQYPAVVVQTSFKTKKRTGGARSSEMTIRLRGARNPDWSASTSTRKAR